MIPSPSADSVAVTDKESGELIPGGDRDDLFLESPTQMAAGPSATVWKKSAFTVIALMGREVPLSVIDVENFVRAAGGGKGYYWSPQEGSSKTKQLYFNQTEPCSLPKTLNVFGLGFGRIEFQEDSDDPKPYLRVPWTKRKGFIIGEEAHGKISTDYRLLLYFVERVWGLARPKLVISITGGEGELQGSDEIQRILLELMRFARRTNAWLTTGGTRVGIMKLIGGSNSRDQSPS